jgi:hypothetical protein
MASGVGAGTHVREIKAGIRVAILRAAGSTLSRCAAQRMACVHPAAGARRSVRRCLPVDLYTDAAAAPALLARSRAGTAGRGDALHRLPGAPADTIPAG